jgi:cytochrome d ubiquinol oxidase subunit I
VVAEYGRQPWSIDGVLPTFLGVSVTPASNVALSLAGFVIFYSALAVVDVYLMVRTIRRGPDGLGYWPPALGMSAAEALVEAATPGAPTAPAERPTPRSLEE